MERIALFVDDAAYAQAVVRAFAPPAGQPTIQWIVVVCPPRLTRRIGKYVAHRTREQWRERWVDSLRDELAPALGPGPANAPAQWIVAREPLPDLVRQLRRHHGITLRVIDARRPRAGVPTDAPLDVSAGPDRERQRRLSRWAAPVAVTSGLSLVLALTD